MKSKNKSLVWVWILPFLLIGSCESFVEVDLPKGQLTNKLVFQDPATAEAAIINILGNLRGSVSSGVFGMTRRAAHYSDEMQPHGTFLQGEFSTLYYNNLLVDNSNILSVWQNAYTMIFAANSVLEGVNAAKDYEISLENKQKLLGEALFLRAFINLYLTGLFGDIPYITSTDYQTNRIVSRSARADVMEALVEDLKQAIEFLPETYSTPERLRPNVWVARGLLARVYLYMEEWEKAESLATALIDQTLFKLNEEEDISKVFHMNSPETIWQFSPQLANGPTLDASTYYFTTGPASGSLTSELINAFSTQDKRRSKWIVQVVGSDGITYYYSQKYKHLVSGNTTERSIQFRLAEQYLIRAECRIRLKMINEGRQDLNRIRQRAGLDPVTASDEDTLINELLEERYRELFLEYPHRLFDVIRTGRTAIFEQHKPNWDDQDRYWPIPEKEIELNPNLMPQNPGY